MTSELKLPARLKKSGWKVKIRDQERLEEPHVTIFQKRRTWRLSLRSNAFLEPGDSWNQIHKKVRAEIEKARNWLVTEWDRIYPHNPVHENDNDDEANE